MLLQKRLGQVQCIVLSAHFNAESRLKNGIFVSVGVNTIVNIEEFTVSKLDPMSDLKKPATQLLSIVASSIRNVLEDVS